MIERRLFLAAGGLFCAGCAVGPAHQRDTSACLPTTAARQAAITPDEALALLREGNRRFVSGQPVACDLRAQVKATAAGQSPFAAVVGCIDSRVPPETVFDQRLGDIFAARIAGNFVNTDIIGSLEFATRVAGAKAIVVLGHSDCGAVKGAVDNAQLGNLTATLANIRPSVAKFTGVPGPQDSTNQQLVQAVADQNAKDAATMLLARSEVLRALVQEGRLAVASAMHDLASGQIRWLG